MKLTYKGVDIFPQVSVNYCVHDMYAEGRSDLLTVRFNDPRGVWSKWQPAAGDVVTFENGPAKTGKMFVYSLKPENGLYTLRAMAMPMTGQDINNKSWEAVRFLQIANEIATRHKLQFVNYGCTDHLYSYLSQVNKTDFEFFYNLCNLEGYQMLIFDGKLLAYNESYLEGMQPAGSLILGSDGVFEYTDNSDLSYGSAEVSSGNYKGVFKAPGTNTRVLRPRENIFATSSAEVTRFAKGLLRSANKYERSGSITKDLALGYAAASLINLTTEKAGAWNGKIFLTRVRHDHINNKSKLFFRKPLEGY